MVAVAQLVESRIVIPVVVGSSPISHPKILEAFTRHELLAWKTIRASLAARPDFDFDAAESLSNRRTRLAPTD